MARTRVPERLIERIHWLGAHDPTWTDEDGRATTQWAVSQALALLQRTVELSPPGAPEPTVSATARGGIVFAWESPLGRELDIVVPADPGSPIEVSRAERQADGATFEDDRDVPTVEDAAAFVSWLNL